MVGELGNAGDATGCHWIPLDEKERSHRYPPMVEPKAVQAKHPKHLKHLTRKKSAVYLAGRPILGDLA